MEQVVYEITRYFIGPGFWLLAGELMFCFKMERRKFFWLRFIPTCALFLSFPASIPDSYNNSFFRIGDWFTWIYLLVFALSVGLELLCFRMPFRKALAFGVAAYTAQNLTHFIRQWMRSDLRLPIDRMWIDILGVLMMIVVFVLFYLIFVRGYQKYGDVNVSDAAVVGFSAFSLGIICALSMFEMLSGMSNLVTHIYGMVSCVLLLALQFGIFRRKKLQDGKETAEKLLELSEKQREISKENIDIINMKCHDIKHQISLMRGRKTDDGFFKDLEDAVTIYDRFVKTGNTTLDLLLTEKNLRCTVHGVRFSYMADGTAIGFMADSDIYSLFGNALDNAVENVLGLSDNAKRIITMKISSVGNMLKIHFDNYCDRKLEFRDGLPVSTKENNGYHGFGMRSIRSIVKKYDGNLTVTVVDNRFCLDILIPIPQSSQQTA